MAENKKKQLQEKYVELKVYEAQLSEIQKQVEAFENHLFELSTILDSLDELKTIPKGTELLVPISPGVFVKARLENANQLTVNVGSSVAVERSIPETKELIEKQMKELEAYRKKLINEFERLSVGARRVQQELLSLSESSE